MAKMVQEVRFCTRGLRRDQQETYPQAANATG